MQTGRDGASVEDVYRYLALLAGLTTFGWLHSALHNLADPLLTLALRARYRTALTEKRTRLEYALLEQPDTWNLIQRVAANPEGGRLKETHYWYIIQPGSNRKIGFTLLPGVLPFRWFGM